jgi:type IV pilus assembly protein PilM
MAWNPFKIIHKKFLGIDIGTSVIKIVELSRMGERIKLENYGETSALTLYEKPFRTFEKSTLTLSSSDIAKTILAILEEAKIRTRQACLSIPDFSTFYTSFDLPPMTKDELPQAVEFEARQHVPLPLSEVSLDWQVIREKVIDKEEVPHKILLVAVPKEVINQYQTIATLSKFSPVTLEAEVFGLVRSLIKGKGLVGLIDVGAQSTTISIIEEGTLILSHSFDVSGNGLTYRTSKSLGVNYSEAEDIKKKRGLIPDQGLKEILTPIVDLILAEIEKISFNFYQKEGKKVEKFVLAGGSAFLPGLKEYFSEKLQKPVEVANPFADIFYPPILEKKLKEMGPAYAIAVGAAIRGLE